VSSQAYSQQPPTGDSYATTTIAVPGAVLTAARGINDARQIVGNYAAGGRGLGFLYDGGSFTTLAGPPLVPTVADTAASGIYGRW
jgi:hypothetical protein